MALIPVQVSLATFYSKFAKSTVLAWHKYDTFQIHLVRFAPGYLQYVIHKYTVRNEIKS